MANSGGLKTPPTPQLLKIINIHTKSEVCSSIQNLKFVAAKISELLHVLCFAGIWTLLGLACDWSEFGQKKSNIFTNGQYELP